MARLYGSIKGDRGEATRKGSANSGIQAHIRGWDVGVEVRGKVEGYDKKKKEEGFDEFEIFATAGSNGGSKRQYLGTVRRSQTDGSIQFYTGDV